MSVRRGLVAALAAYALVVTGCGSADQPESAGAGVTSTVGAAATSSTTTDPPAPTTIPLVPVPDDAVPRSTTTTDRVAPAATTTAGPATTPPPETGPPANPPPGQTPELPPGDIGDLPDIFESLPTIAPPDGAGTAIRAEIGPVEGLAVGDTVTIEASNLPPGQFMAWGQCTEQGKDSADPIELLTFCDSFGVGTAAADGTATETVLVVGSIGGTDCRIEPCFVGIIVFPGGDGLRRYEQISLAG